MKKVFYSLTIICLLVFSSCDGKKVYHDITDTDSIATGTEQDEEVSFLDDNTTPLNEEELMQAEALCGEWGWVDTDKEDDLPILFLLTIEDGQLSAPFCVFHQSTIGEMRPECSYRNGVLKLEERYKDEKHQRHMKIELELNPRGDLVGTYYLQLNPDNIREGKLTMRNGYFKYGDNNEEE